MGQCLSSFNNPSVRNESIDVSFQNKDMDEWTVDDVYNWLLSVNITDNNLYSVTTQFKENNINGLGLKGIDTEYLINKIGISIDDTDQIISARDARLNHPVHTQPNMTQPDMTSNSSLDINMTSLYNDDTFSPPKPNRIIITEHVENPIPASSPSPSPIPMEINKNLSNQHIQPQVPLDQSFLSELVQIGLSGSVFSKSTSTYGQIGQPSPKKTCSQPPPDGGWQLPGNHSCGKTLTPAQLVIVQSKSQEEKKSDDNGTILNIYAPIFAPKQPQIPTLQRNYSAPMQPLSAIDETKAVHLHSTYQMMHTQIKIQNKCKEEEKKEITEFKSCDNDKHRKRKKKEVHPKKKEVHWKKFGAKGNIQISRRLTNTIIPNAIRENIPNLFEYMDKSTMIQRGDQYNDGKIRIFNYDFHNKQEAALYCVARKLIGPKNTHLKWKMDEKLYTAKDIVNQFGNVDMPTSSRQKPSFLREIHNKHQIKNAIKSHETNGIISKTKWTKIKINTNMDNKQRFILAIDKTEFIRKVNEYIKKNDNVNVLPILVFNNNEYHVEHIHIVRIAENVDIGISYKYEKNNVKVTEICLKKQDILSRHMLVSPHDCHCLDNFITNIDMIKIGNVECEMNQIKDLKKRLNDANDTISKLNVELEKLKNEDNTAYLTPVDGGLNSPASASPITDSSGSNTPNWSPSSMGSGSGSGSAESNNIKFTASKEI